MLEMASVKNQRKIINGEHSHCQVTLTNGSILDLEVPLPDFPLEAEIDITKKFLTRLNTRIDKGI